MIYFSNASWWSASELCKSLGGSLPQLHFRDEIHELLSHDGRKDELYAIYVGLQWVSSFTKQY